MSTLRILGLLALAPFYAAASQQPMPIADEPRIRTIDYNEHDVVELKAYFGYALHIRFGDGETIQNVTLGDSGAWSEEPHRNHLYIKPIADEPETNMSVLTDRHSYEFHLTAQDVPQHFDTRRATFSVEFRYPEDAARMNAAIEEARAEQGSIDQSMAATRGKHRNLNYWGEGSADVIPDRAWDDGLFTYLKFNGGRELPVVFLVGADGKETLVNTRIDGTGTIVVQQLAAHLVLRKGGVVACVYNRSYDPTQGDAPSGTISPTVQRSVPMENPR